MVTLELTVARQRMVIDFDTKPRVHCQGSRRAATNMDTQYTNEPLRIQSAPFSLLYLHL